LTTKVAVLFLLRGVGRIGSRRRARMSPSGRLSAGTLTRIFSSNPSLRDRPPV